MGTKTVSEKQKLIFDDFRHKYPGVKRGLDTELSNFMRHKDWSEVVQELVPALDFQKARRAKISSRGGWVPQWKNLRTWINQRCWEETYGEEDDSNNSPPKARPNPDGRYYRPIHYDD